MSDPGTFPDLASLTDALGYTEAPASAPFVSDALPSELTFATQNLQPPTPLYVTESDSLQLTVWNHMTAIEVDLTGRILRADGTIIRIFQPLFPTNNRVANIFKVNLPQGFLLDISINTPASAVARGQCFAQCTVVRGASAALSAVQLLAQDYVATGLAMQWPGGLVRSPIEGPGFIVSQTTTVGAGLDWAFIVPVNARWRIRSITATLNTAATVANRFAGVLLRDSLSNIYYEFVAPYTHTAGISAAYTFAPGIPYVQGGGFTLILPLPTDTTLFSNMKFGSGTNGLQAGDTWTNITASVEEWIEPQ